MNQSFPYTSWHLGRTGKPKSVIILRHADEKEGWMYPVGQTDEGEYHRLTELYVTKKIALQKALLNIEAAEIRHRREAVLLEARRVSIQNQIDKEGEK